MKCIERIATTLVSGCKVMIIMFKLMKYEFRKQLFSKILILILLGVLEIMFLIGLFAESNNLLGWSIGLFSFVSVIAVMFVVFESILTFSNDLKTKQSYMLFLTPNSAYKIIGSKVLTSLIYVFLTAATLIAITLLDMGIVIAKYENLSMVLEFLEEVFYTIFKANIDITLVITILLYFLFDLAGVMVIGMASITLSATFLANSKGKAIVSIIFFFGINFILSKLENLLPSVNLVDTTPYYYHCLFSAVVMLVFYFATSYMLEKKVSV